MEIKISGMQHAYIAETVKQFELMLIELNLLGAVVSVMFLTHIHTTQQ